MQKKRLNRFLNETETHLRFYVLYLSYMDSQKEHSDFRDLALFNYQELQHRFIEVLSFNLKINVTALEKGELSVEQERRLDRLLNRLHEESVDNLLTSEFTSWLKNDREKYFFHSMLKAMVIAKVNLVRRPDDTKTIGEILWPQLKDKQYLEGIEKRKQSAKKRAFENISEGIRKANEEAERIFQEREDRREKRKQEEFDNIRLDSTLEAVKLVCRLCTTIDKDSHIIIINYLTYHCISGDLDLTTVQDLLLRIRSMYIKACAHVSLSWDILKTENDKLIDKTYERLQSQYQIYNLFYPAEDTCTKKKCIVTTLDLLFTTSANFPHRLKLLTDKFSLDKANSEDFQIALNQKQWNMLVELANGDTKPKINRTINKLLKDAYKDRFSNKT
ncbi:hypothetical protein [Vibrio aestuarianus]|uniref:hypothetical protein n=1 Tax=Vibrio aestuarianus TaxID=28171 RepID=UPI00237CC7B8|nr:hypothetical protein [Vibrio aestuarianus]MDE1329025.1 hypothetical protein [Vibrio aestuarianus]